MTTMDNPPLPAVPRTLSNTAVPEMTEVKEDLQSGNVVTVITECGSVTTYNASFAETYGGAGMARLAGEVVSDSVN